jgi:hypothetical protein
MNPILQKLAIDVFKEIYDEYTYKATRPSYNDILPLIPPDFVDDGCSFSPDKFWCCGRITEVCRVHDYLYDKGGSEADRKFADSVLRRGIIECARRGKWKYIRTRWVAFIYWRATRRCGKFFFNYTDGTEIDLKQVVKITVKRTKLKKKVEKILENI